MISMHIAIMGIILRGGPILRSWLGCTLPL
jgi:hypothetical protein